MSLDQLETQLMDLPRDERREFAKWFYDHEHEFTEVAENDGNERVRAEINRRADEIRDGRVLAVPVTNEWFDQLKQKLANARPAQAPAR